MLVIGRREGQWVHAVNAKTGEVLPFKIYDIIGPSEGRPGSCRIAFDDPERLYEISRPETRYNRERREAQEQGRQLGDY